MDQILNHWAELCASIVAIGSFVTLIWKYVIRPTKENITRILKLHEELQNLVPVINAMQKELKPNGGSSLFDMIKRIDHTLVMHTQKFNFMITYESRIAFETDANGQCLWVSAKWQEFTGLPISEAMGWGWINGIHPEDRKRVSEEWQEAVKQHRPFMNMQYRYLNVDRKIDSMVLVTAYPMLDSTGKVTGYFGVGRLS